MVEDGYTAVSSRRVGARAGVDPALVYYYFGTMDDLFLELFRRQAERGLERQREVLASPQPLWSLWDYLRDQMDAAVLVEFNALANHRKAVKAEIIAYSAKFRTAQVERLAEVLAGYGVDQSEWPAAAFVLALTSVSRFLLNEESFGITLGHDDTVRVVEAQIRRLEGDRGAPVRQPPDPRYLRGGRG